MRYEDHLLTNHQLNIHSAIFKIAEIRNLKIASSDAMEGLIHDIYDILEELQYEFDILQLKYVVDDGDELYENQQQYIFVTETEYSVHCNSEPFTVLDDSVNLVVCFDTDFNKVHFTPLAAGAVDEILGAAAHDHTTNLWHDFVLSL